MTRRGQPSGARASVSDVVRGRSCTRTNLFFVWTPRRTRRWSSTRRIMTGLWHRPHDGGFGKDETSMKSDTIWVRACQVERGDTIVGPASMLITLGECIVEDPNQTCKHPGRDQLIGFTNGRGIAVDPNE